LDILNKAEINQKGGSFNYAEQDQDSPGGNVELNNAFIMQDGSMNTAVQDQMGGNNSSTISQTGKGNNAFVTQTMP